jgi:hypothetical protein
MLDSVVAGLDKSYLADAHPILENSALDQTESFEKSPEF